MGEGNKFSFSKDLGIDKGSLQPFPSIVIHLVPLYTGLGVTAPARADLFSDSSRSSSFLFLPVVHSFKTGSQQVITQY